MPNQHAIAQARAGPVSFSPFHHVHLTVCRIPYPPHSRSGPHPPTPPANCDTNSTPRTVSLITGPYVGRWLCHKDIDRSGILMISPIKTCGWQIRVQAARRSLNTNSPSTACSKGYPAPRLGEKAGGPTPQPAGLENFGWQSHCQGLFELPIAA
jgi:hypothetical protein